MTEKWLQVDNKFIKISSIDFMEDCENYMHLYLASGEWVTLSFLDENKVTNILNIVTNDNIISCNDKVENYYYCEHCNKTLKLNDGIFIHDDVYHPAGYPIKEV